MRDAVEEVAGPVERIDDETRLGRIAGDLTALVLQRDDEARVQERELAQTASEHVVLNLDLREDLVVGLEGDLRAGALGVADDLERSDGRAASVLLKVHVAFAFDLELEPLADRVDGADADAVETGGDLVAGVIELAPSVEDRHHDLGRADALRVHARGNAAAVVLDRETAVEVDGDVHLRTEAAEMLVDRVVDDLPDEVVEAGAVVHVADVHARTLAHGLEAFEDGDVVAAIIRRGRRARVAGERTGDRGNGCFGRNLRHCSV